MEENKVDVGAGWLYPQSIQFPLSIRWEPQPDITAFELAILIPYFFGKLLYQEGWEKMGPEKRHIVIEK